MMFVYNATKHLYGWNNFHSAFLMTTHNRSNRNTEPEKENKRKNGFLCGKPWIAQIYTYASVLFQ